MTTASGAALEENGPWQHREHAAYSGCRERSFRRLQWWHCRPSVNPSSLQLRTVDPSANTHAPAKMRISMSLIAAGSAKRKRKGSQGASAASGLPSSSSGSGEDASKKGRTSSAGPLKGFASFVLTIDPPTSEDQLNVQTLRVQNHQLMLRIALRSEELEEERKQVARLRDNLVSYQSAFNTIKRGWAQFDANVSEIMSATQAPSDRMVTSDVWSLAFSTFLSKDIDECDALVKEQVMRSTEMLRQLLAHVDARAQHAAPDAAQLEEARAKLAADRHALTQEAERAKAHAANSEARVEEMRAMLQETELKFERANIQAANLHDRLLAMEASAAATAAEASAAPARAPSEGAAATPLTPQASGGEVSSEVRKELEILREQCQGRLAEITKLASDLARANAEIDVLRAHAGHVSDDAVHKSGAFQALLAQYTAAKSHAEALQARLEEKSKEHAALEEVRRREIDAFVQAEAARRKATEAEIRSLTEQLMSVSVARDKLRQELDESKFREEHDSGKLAAEAQQLAATLQAQNHVLKSQVVMLRQRQLTGQQFYGDDSLVAQYQQQVHTMQAELTELRAKYKKTAESEEELRLVLFSAPSEKKDPVLTERKLRDEVAMLREQLGSFSRMGEQRDVAAYVRKLEEQLDSKGKDEEALFAEMEEIGKALEALQEQNARLVAQLQSKEGGEMKLLRDKAKAAQLHANAVEEKQLLVAQVDALKTDYQRQASLLTQLQENERHIRSNFDHSSKRLAEVERLLEVEKNTAMTKSTDLHSRDVALKDLREEVQRLTATLQDKAKMLQDETNRVHRAKEDLNALQKRFDDVKHLETHGSGGDAIMEQQYLELRNKLKCSACNVNLKDTVLLKCFHIFCEECVKLRIETRQRKCPGCQTPFGHSDFRRIYIT